MASPLILVPVLLLTGCFHGHSYTPQRTVTTWRDMQRAASTAQFTARSRPPRSRHPLSAVPRRPGH